MEDTDRTIVKCFVFGVGWALLWVPLDRTIGGPLAAGIASAIAVALFHWLPPRVHPNLTFGRSAAATLAAGVTSAVVSAAIERFL